MFIAGTNEFGELMEFFIEKGVRFHHACQLKDFQSYVELGGIPSRNKLEKLPHTPFKSDNSDKLKGAWTLVFGNLEDLGAKYFWQNRQLNALPCVYGPILLIGKCELWKSNVLKSISITEKSASNNQWNRELSCLSLEKVYKYYEDNNKYFNNLEVSLELNQELIMLNDIAYMRLDPVDGLKERIEEMNLSFPRYERDCTDKAKDVFNEIMADLKAPEQSTFPNQDLDWQYKRFAEYWKEGTLSSIP